MLRTPLCDLLGIEYPIPQSGMRRVAGPDLVAEVSNAGGLGILAGLALSGEDLRAQIRRVRALTDKPFGVNLWLHGELRPPPQASSLPAGRVASVQDTLNRFRRTLQIPETTADPPPMPDTIDEALGVILEERVPVWSIGLGDPGAEMVARCRARNVKVIAMVATVEDARVVAASGVDAVVAQGMEAGGHRSTFVKAPSRDSASVGTMALVPQIVDAVGLPVIAAGGLADGRGVAAALALGASGALFGTRFVATRESQAPEFWKRAILAGTSEATVTTDVFSGLYARALANRFVAEYEESGAPVLPGLLQSNAAQDIYQAAAARGREDYFPLWAGQSAGLIREILGAGEVFRAIVSEAEAAIERLCRPTPGA